MSNKQGPSAPSESPQKEEKPLIDPTVPPPAYQEKNSSLINQPPIIVQQTPIPIQPAIIPINEVTNRTNFTIGLCSCCAGSHEHTEIGIGKDWNRCSLNICALCCTTCFTYMVWEKFIMWQKISPMKFFFGNWIMKIATTITIIYGFFQVFCPSYAYYVTPKSPSQKPQDYNTTYDMDNINTSSIEWTIYSFITFFVGLVAYRLRTYMIEVRKIDNGNIDFFNHIAHFLIGYIFPCCSNVQMYKEMNLHAYDEAVQMV